MSRKGSYFRSSVPRELTGRSAAPSRYASPKGPHPRKPKGKRGGSRA